MIPHLLREEMDDEDELWKWNIYMRLHSFSTLHHAAHAQTARDVHACVKVWIGGENPFPQSHKKEIYSEAAESPD